MFWEAGMNDEGVVLEVIAVDVGSCPWGWGWVDMEVPLWWMFLRTLHTSCKSASKSNAGNYKR